MNRDVEATELVGMCLWDNFADNHDVVVADTRVADLGTVPRITAITASTFTKT